MAETLGSLCDKLTIIKLKQWHSEDPDRLRSLESQQRQLVDEINTFVSDAAQGKIAIDRLTFAANKVFKKAGNEIAEAVGSIGEVFAQLAVVNCDLWHEQEKVYEFEKVTADKKDGVVKRLAVLNLQRNQCIDRIDKQFQQIIRQSTPHS